MRGHFILVERDPLYALDEGLAGMQSRSGLVPKKGIPNVVSTPQQNINIIMSDHKNSFVEPNLHRHV
jgi:hypothetical protein